MQKTNELTDSKIKNNKSQPNPYNLFLILILLINSYGLANSLAKKNKNNQTKEDGRKPI